MFSIEECADSTAAIIFFQRGAYPDKIVIRADKDSTNRLGVSSKTINY